MKTTITKLTVATAILFAAISTIAAPVGEAAVAKATAAPKAASAGVTVSWKVNGQVLETNKATAVDASKVAKKSVSGDKNLILVAKK